MDVEVRRCVAPPSRDIMLEAAGSRQTCSATESLPADHDLVLMHFTAGWRITGMCVGTAEVV